MSKRRVRPDELDLWRQVTKNTERLDVRKVFQPKPTKPAQKTDVQPEPNPPQPLTRFEVGERSRKRDSQATLPPSIKDRLSTDPVQMDKKAFTRLKRGKLLPDARLDLHGMTLDQAHGALTGFILRAQSRGHRLVLIITGKGARHDPHDPAPRRRGVLKQQVPMWLRMAPLGQAVMQISEAHIRHGGTGAYYVYLRKNR
ncbi:Smr/MutS family protein [Primorskyibacter flagellatus]|uniref:Smr/MutS family protein n=1 Tax=Primorskyibacter flagellatus TaxID=1387277 RepID=UPI003A951D55